MKPALIWLLIGLPIDLEQLVARLSVADALLHNDFCLEYAPPGWPNFPPHEIREWLSTRFSLRYDAAVGAPLAKLSDMARSCGVVVIESADLHALREAARRAATIVIVAHWKAHEFVASDFLPQFESEGRTRLAGSDRPIAGWLRRQTDPLPWYRTYFQQPNTLRRALNLLPLADLVDQPALGDADQFVELPATRAARRRSDADALFADLVRPGNRLELFDGLHSREAVADALAGFSGTVDLTMCTSTWLGDFITRTSGYTIRTVQFPTVQEFNDAGLRLMSVFDLVRQGYDYMTARHAVANLFEAEIGREAAARGLR